MAKKSFKTTADAALKLMGEDAGETAKKFISSAEGATTPLQADTAPAAPDAEGLGNADAAERAAAGHGSQPLFDAPQPPAGETSTPAEPQTIVKDGKTYIVKLEQEPKTKRVQIVLRPSLHAAAAARAKAAGLSFNEYTHKALEYYNAHNEGSI